jgi:DNA-binding transcriptional regulator YhcF (GntR family)
MAQALKRTQSKRDSIKRNESKWSATLMEAGWTVLPSILLERQHALGLDAVDINIIMHLVRHWWFPDSLPHPSKRTIAQCMSINESTVRRHIAAMEKIGFIKRIPRRDRTHGQMTNEYDFSGLIKEATPYAEDAIEERRLQRLQSAAKRNRKKPMLRMAPDNKT